MDFTTLKEKEHSLYLYCKRRKLKNRTPSIIASNCTGAVILHDLGLRFNAPTVNLYILPDDFLKFAENPKDYLSYELEELPENFPFPVGALHDIKIYFQHYSTFAEAKSKWEERSRRVDFDNLFFMMTERDGCTGEQVARFDRLPWENKVIFTKKPYPQYRSACYIKGFEEEEELGVLTDWNAKSFLKRRYIDDFDYVKFLNGQGLSNGR